MPTSHLPSGASPSHNPQSVSGIVPISAPNSGLSNPVQKVITSENPSSFPAAYPAYYPSAIPPNTLSHPAHIPRTSLHPMLSQQHQQTQHQQPQPPSQPGSQSAQQQAAATSMHQPSPSILPPSQHNSQNLPMHASYPDAMMHLQHVVSSQQYRQLPPTVLSAPDQQSSQMQRLMPVQLPSNPAAPVQQVPVPSSHYLPQFVQQQRSMHPSNNVNATPPNAPPSKPPMSNIVSQNGTYYSIPSVPHPVQNPTMGVAAPSTTAEPPSVTNPSAPSQPATAPTHSINQMAPNPSNVSSSLPVHVAAPPSVNANPQPPASVPVTSHPPPPSATLTSVMPPNAPESVRKLISLNEEAWLQIGHLAELYDDSDKALTAYEAALRQNPYSIPAMLQIATLLRNREQFLLAIEYYQTILDLDPKQGEIWSALGHCYLMRDDLSRAYSAYRQALYHLKDPKNPKLWYGIGILYDRYGSHEHAEEAFTQCLRMDPNFEKVNEIYFRLGIIYKQQHKFAQSLDLFRYILNHPPKPLTVLDIYFQIGHVYEQQKEYKLAKEAYERVLAETPNHAKVLQQLGWLCHQQSSSFTNQDLAIQYLTKSLEADDTDAQSWYLIGRCYVAQQKYNKAYEAYQQAVYRDGRNPTFWCSIGVLYYQINQYQDALDAYSRAIRLNPYISEVWYDLGTLYESCHNQVSDALDAYQRAAELDPSNPHIRARLQLLRGSSTDQHKLASSAAPPAIANQNAKFVGQPASVYPGGLPAPPASSNWQVPQVQMQSQAMNQPQPQSFVTQAYGGNMALTNGVQHGYTNAVPQQSPSSVSALGPAVNQTSPTQQMTQQTNSATAVPAGMSNRSRPSISNAPISKSPQIKNSEQSRSRHNSISAAVGQERSNSISSRPKEQKGAISTIDQRERQSGSPKDSLKKADAIAMPNESPKSAETSFDQSVVGQETTQEVPAEKSNKRHLPSNEKRTEEAPLKPQSPEGVKRQKVIEDETQDNDAKANTERISPKSSPVNPVEEVEHEQESESRESSEERSQNGENSVSEQKNKSRSPKQTARTLDVDEDYDEEEVDRDTAHD
ncbi:transcriptional corepressor Ssn6 [Schizosaccharomyces cryophilus OY26]|uniref:Transcriptional corepressor Ssn6 n=1 Tax=Schizosaccharomyces cryophilus (strain OY26 / ATCC MYA-4695 / CBS 11777 / NBRC 106824 / NRRL Y48691) TaxID=653667 RepID=S9XJ23_SCHCR|nr:transcriptional corepressor Ssn6 [Schizosaccharomyces cryophilus OY26]EPY53631.1 transcriptional corepressor Ssn6 [Schizosaccharomyces cryophilus OY26]